MTVYVDDARNRYRGMFMCHMIADSDDELQAMADTIGVKRIHWQAPPDHDSHFDICVTKRAAAVKAGAVRITLRQLAAMNMRRRITGELGAPDDAWRWLSEHYAQRRAAKAAEAPA